MYKRRPFHIHTKPIISIRCWYDSISAAWQLTRIRFSCVSDHKEKICSSCECNSFRLAFWCTCFSLKLSLKKIWVRPPLPAFERAFLFICRRLTLFSWQSHCPTFVMRSFIDYKAKTIGRCCFFESKRFFSMSNVIEPNQICSRWRKRLSGRHVHHTDILDGRIENCSAFKLQNYWLLMRCHCRYCCHNQKSWYSFDFFTTFVNVVPKKVNI